MRVIDLGVIHCSGTRETQDFKVEDLRDLHVNKNGWSDIGYHFYYEKDGTEHFCRPIERQGAHARDFNSTSVGLCYEGGLDAFGKPKDTRTEKQKARIASRIFQLRCEFGDLPIVGHRDLSPDKNRDGEVQKGERLKECPCYEVIPNHNSPAILKKYLIHYLNGVSR